MPVVGVASKLRQPEGVSGRPVHTALPIPNLDRTTAARGYLRGTGPGALSCQLSVRSTCDPRERSKESEDRKVSKATPLETWLTPAM
ncbi:hypothetical protein Z043_110214 [Scleropages formosus]|uniref:Uncharacterized protein n=1 Tax=Scleropages formosus TaxID=113540 RepID=A0A0P7UAG4_SCLFO|nr:hypothetical protein Z043_110214 [Scleropages formosus]